MGLNAPTFTAQNVADSIRRQFGDESGAQIVDSDIIRWINEAQLDIITTNPVLRGRAASNTAVDASTLDISALPILRIQSIWINNVRIDRLGMVEAEDRMVRQDPTNTLRGVPQYWWEWAGIINIYPAADNTYPVVINYLSLPPKILGLADSLPLPDTYFNRIVEYCMGKALELDEDLNGSQVKMGQYTNGLSALSEQENTPEMESYPTITTYPEDWY